MANISHKYRHNNMKEPSVIYLSKPGKKILCALNGIDDSSANITLRTNNTAQLEFTVNKYDNGHITNGYEQIDELMELYCSGIWFKILDPPTIEYDGTQEKKTVSAESYEIMLSQYQLNGFKINTGDESSYEVMYRKSLTENTDQFYQVKFCDKENHDLSLLHLVLKHADVPGWDIGYIDDITPNQNSKPEEPIYLSDEICNFDVDETSVYSFLINDVSSAYKCVFEFDTQNMLINVYRAESFGKDTGITLGFRNIQNNVTVTRDDSLITQFYVGGLDGYDIPSVNFKSNVITDLSYFICEPYMSKQLQDKYSAFVEYRESRRDEYIENSKQYNNGIEILSELELRVPIDTAQNDWFGSKVEDLKSAYNENMAIIIAYENLYVDESNNFDLDALKKSNDWPVYESIMNYTLPSIVAALQAQDEPVEGYGSGNIISNVNPVVLGEEWITIGSNYALFTPYQLDDSPAYGITRGIKAIHSSDATIGLLRNNISVQPKQNYTLSCFVKCPGQITLEYASTGEERNKSNHYVMSDDWVRIFTSFTADATLIDIAFTSDSDFEICGMQLELGELPSQFGYFIQSDSSLKAYETDWKLYGIKELETKYEVYKNSADELNKNGLSELYSSLSKYDEEYHTQMYQKYLDYIKLSEECELALNERKEEYNTEQEKLNQILSTMDQIVNDVDINHFGDIQSEYPAFTSDEIYTLKNLCVQSNYSNENIITTVLDSLSDTIDKQKTLYDDAIDQLYVESHPQYSYSDDINNIYALPEFKEFHDDLQVNNFIRVGLDDKRYVKLRVVEISFNPCTLDETMEITFSDMIKYKNKRNDIAYIISDLNKSVRNGGKVNSIDKSNTSSYVIDAGIIKSIFYNPLFGSMLSGVSTGGTGSKVTADKVLASILEADTATIKSLSSHIIESNVINSDVANIKYLIAGKVETDEITTIKLTADNVEITDAAIKNLIASRISVNDLLTVCYEDGKPAIEFSGAMQQFYDKDGKLRIKIGNDSNNIFNFLIFDSTGSKSVIGIDSSGNAYFEGEITSSSGKIGGFTIGTNSLYNGAGTFGGSGVYVSTSGISCGSNFQVNSSGIMNVKNANIIGNIVAKSIAAQDEYKIFYSDYFDDTMSPSSKVFVKAVKISDYNYEVIIGEDLGNSNELSISFERSKITKENSITLSSDTVYCKGSVYLTNGAYSSSSIKMSNNNRYNLESINGDSINGIFASAENVVTIASASYPTLLRGSSITASTTITTTSDERLKKDFRDLSQYEKFFMDIEPVSFKYKNESSDKYHIGVKAQQILTALQNNGLSSADFAGFVEMPVSKDMFEGCNYVPDFDTMYNIGYSEFTSLNTYMTQKAHHRIDAQEERINYLISTIQKQSDEIILLKNEIQLLKQQI